MNQADILSGKAGLAGIQWAITGRSSRRRLRCETQSMLRQGYKAGPFHLTRAKYKPGRKLSAYFTVPVSDAAGQTSHSIHLAVDWGNNPDGSVHTDGRGQLLVAASQSGLLPVQRELWKDILDQGIELQIWPLDPVFPQLVRLGDPVYVASLFTSIGIAHDAQHLPVVTPIRYRPGERHVLRYEIHSPGVSGDHRQRLYAKLYTSAEDAARAFGVANRVVDWLATNPHGLQGNRPEAMSADVGAIFYPHAPGIPLSHQLYRSGRWLGLQLQMIGKALAFLHAGPITMQSDLRQNNITNEVKVIKRASEHIQVFLPQTYEKILEILDIAQEQYGRLPQEKPTFTHSDFKADHLLSTSQGLTLIDFDTCTLTDPALDIGKFLADLEWWFTLKGISGLEEAQAELLKGYANEVKPELNDERLARAKLFYTLILVKIVVRRVPLYHKRWASMTARMIERAAQTLTNVIKV